MHEQGAMCHETAMSDAVTVERRPQGAAPADRRADSDLRAPGVVDTLYQAYSNLPSQRD